MEPLKKVWLKNKTKYIQSRLKKLECMEVG